MRNDNDIRPWYHEPWPWVIIGLPAVIVVACIGMLIVAIRHDDSVVHDNYYKEGLAINLRLAEDEVATRLQLTGRLQLDLTSGDVSLLLQSNAQLDPPAELALVFTHPLNDDADFTVTLKPVAGDSYRGDLTRPINGRWHLELRNDAGESWRLRETVDIPPDSAAPLQWELRHE